MDFESPDVEKDFPGLYASESGRKSNESDFSDESHEKPSKKELLIGKKKEKKDKDLRYATLEGESSVDEDAEVKGILKSKKSKTFKFSSKKEKDKDKDKEKDVIDKDKKKESKKEKEKKKDVKFKNSNKKKKQSDGVSDIAEELPIFGVNLESAVKRNPCHDGIDVPLIFRLCVERVEESISTEGLYKTTAIKSCIHRLKRMVNQREEVDLSTFDVFVATNLLKSFIKDLPEPVFPSELLSNFRLGDNSGNAAQYLVNGLPYFNKQFINWLLIHLKHVVSIEKQNKMTLQVIATVFSPLLQIDSQILSFLIINSSVFFPNFNLIKYIPPLNPSSSVLPETSQDITAELKKQESVLGLIHWEMSTGCVSKLREEQLWETQRMITQLKRKLRSLEKPIVPTQQPVEVPNTKDDEFSLNLSLQKPPIKLNPEANESLSLKTDDVEKREKNVPDELDTPKVSVEIPILAKASVEIPILAEANLHPVDEVGNLAEDLSSMDLKESANARALLFETEELLNVILDLKANIVSERKEIEKLKDLLSKAGLSTEVNLSIDLDDCKFSEQNNKLRKETLFLETQEMSLVKNIIKEREAIIDLRVQIRMLEHGDS